jgi:hypothetical protein
MKKIVILTLGFLGGAFVLSLLIMQALAKGVPGKVQFVSMSLWDPLVIHLVMMAFLLVVFTIVWGAGKIVSKKLKWGKWKTGLICSLELLFWALIFWMAYVYSIRMTTILVKVPAQLSVGPLMSSLKAFVFYFLRNVLILGIGMHLILLAGWFFVRLLRKKWGKKWGQVSTFDK